jgi:hypothetical protein
MKSIYVLLIFPLCLLALAPARADTFYPMLMGIHPVAVQAGATTECEASARYNLHGAYQVFVTGTGVTTEVDPPKPATPKPVVQKLKVRFKVAADALLGPREVRIATPQGVSTVGQVVVVRDPIVREAEPNDTLATAQAITLPATICGSIGRLEDVDYYKFKVAAGTSLTFHVQCQRLQNKIHDLQEHADPILTLRNAGGTVLAVNDNYFYGDSLLNYRFATAGEYFLEIRDTRYSGHPDWYYAIEINDRPFVTNVHPIAVTAGVATRLQLIGFTLPADPHTTLTLPAETPDGLHWIMLPLGNGQLSNAAPVIVSRLPQVLEADGDNNTAGKAQAVPVPAGISGRIETPGDVDCYSFEAKAGERFCFEVVARDHQSALDSIIRVCNDKGDRLIENDDYFDRLVHADSRIENWAAPANGRFVVEIRDLHQRGGPNFVYFLKITRSQPHFELDIDTDKTLLAPGTAAPIYVRVRRKNGFTGEVQLAIDGLPPGVSATCGRALTETITGMVVSNGLDGCIVLRAAPDAKMTAANIRITGTATHQEGTAAPVTLTAVARPMQEVYFPGGGRSNYYVETHAVSIGEPLDLKSVQLSTTAVTLKPGESQKIDVTIDRAAGFKSNVTLDVVYQHLGTLFGNSLPPGVTMDEKASQTLLAGDQVKGTIVLKAAPDAKPVEKQQIAIMAHVSINFVMKFTYCGEPVLITVLKP